MVLLCVAGVAGGYGVGRVVDGARSLLAGPESLPADKVAAPEPLDVGGPATACRPENVELRLSSSANTVTAGSPMSFMVRVTNVGRVPCLFDGAAASRAVTITDESGKERVWSSADCSDGSTMLLLGPEDVNAGEVHWKSVQSAKGCPKGSAAVGPGTYRATATLADVPGAKSEPVTFTVAEKAKATDSGEDAQAGDPGTEAKSSDTPTSDTEPAEDKTADEKTADEKTADEKTSDDAGEDG
ncbi:hypothetical protein ACQFYA_04735 [Promicromonospora sp. Marseille-Q5078]